MEHSKINLLKHLELSAEAIKTMQENLQKNAESQTMKELKKKLQEMRKKFKQQNQHIKKQNTQLERLEKLLSIHRKELEKPGNSLGIKRSRWSTSEPEEGVKLKKRIAKGNAIKSEFLSTPIKFGVPSAPIKSEFLLLQSGLRFLLYNQV